MQKKSHNLQLAHRVFGTKGHQCEFSHKKYTKIIKYMKKNISKIINNKSFVVNSFHLHSFGKKNKHTHFHRSL